MNILTKMISMLDGWKSVIGYIGMLIAEAILRTYPEFPAPEFLVVFQWFAGLLLAIGLGHKMVKDRRNKNR